MEYIRRIVKPLSRVKSEVYAKFKIGISDAVVAGVIGIVIIPLIIFLSFAGLNTLVKTIVSFTLGPIIGLLSLIGKPHRRLWNYVIIIFGYLSTKRKFKGKEVAELNPYSRIQNGHLISKGNKTYTVVYRIMGKNIVNGLEHDIENNVTEFAELFKSQTCNYQIIKLEERFDTKIHLKNLNKIYSMSDGIRKEVLKENMRVMKAIGEDQKGYHSNYYLLLSSKNADRLEEEQLSVEYACSSAGMDIKKLNNIELLIFFKRKYFPNLKITDHESTEEDEENNSDINLESVFLNLSKEKEYKFKTGLIETPFGVQATIAIDEYPTYSNLAWMADIFNLKNTQVQLQIRNIPNAEAVKMLDNTHREMRSRVRDTKSNKLSDSAHNDIVISSLEVLSEEIQGAGEELKTTTLYITIYGKNNLELSRQRNFIYKTIRKNKMKFDKLSFKQQAWWFSNPAHIRNYSFETRNTLEISTTNLALGWPFLSGTFNDVTGDYIGSSTEGKPCFFDPSYRDAVKERHQSNSMVLGTTGAGKSTQVKIQLKNEWARGTNCYVIDPEAEYTALAKSLGGTTIELSGERGSDGIIHRINPLQVFTGEHDEESVKDWIGNHFKFLSDFFSQIMFPSQVDTVIEMNYLKVAISNLYKKAKITNNNAAKLKNNKWPTLSDLYKQLIVYSKRAPKNFSKKEIFQDIAERMFDITKNGTDGNLWDGHTTLDLQKESFITFDFKTLIKAGNTRLAGAQSHLTYKYILHIIYLNADKAKKKGEIQNVSITIDEAHKFINKDNPAAVLFAFTMYKQIRKYHGWIRMTTQSIGDFTMDEKIKRATSGIINTTEFLFIFHVKPQDVENIDDLMKVNGGLTQREKAFLIRKVSHRYLFYSNQYKIMIKTSYTREEKKQIGWVEFKNKYQ